MKTISPSSSPTRSDSSPCTSNLGKASSSSSLPRHFTRSISIPFASAKVNLTSPTEPSMNLTVSVSSQPPNPKSMTKKKTVSSQSPHSSDPKKDNVCFRPLWPEYCVKLKYFPKIRELIEQRVCSLSVTHLQPPNENLVREFYANLDDNILNKKSKFLYLAYIWGNRFRFSPSTIGCVKKIKTIPHPIFYDDYKPSFKEIGSEITSNSEFVWNGKELPFTVLSEFYRILHKIALSNRWANSNISTINYNTTRFLFALGGSPIVYEHDKILHVPILGKSFTLVHGKSLPLSVMDVFATGKALAFFAPSSVTAPSAPLEGVSPASWQNQLFSKVNEFADNYARDQLHQRQFEKTVIDVLTVMTEMLKSFEACPDIPAHDDLSSSPDDGGAFSVHSFVLSPSNVGTDPFDTTSHISFILDSTLQPSSVGDDHGSSTGAIAPKRQGEQVSVRDQNYFTTAGVQGETSNAAQSSTPVDDITIVHGSATSLVAYSSSD
uniref:Uncharacterized protein n=1 Tax=Cannabis sativa TaxID=3483 RepID=A0A803QFZ9_CANSA